MIAAPAFFNHFLADGFQTSRTKIQDSGVTIQFAEHPQRQLHIVQFCVFAGYLGIVTLGKNPITGHQFIDSNLGWGFFRQASIGKPLGNGFMVAFGGFISSKRSKVDCLAIENSIRLTCGFVVSQFGCPAFPAWGHRFGLPGHLFLL